MGLQYQSKQIIYVILRIFFLFYAKNHHIRSKSDKMRPSSAAFSSMAAIHEEMQTIRCIEHDGRRKFITPFVGDQVI